MKRIYGFKGQKWRGNCMEMFCILFEGFIEDATEQKSLLAERETNSIEEKTYQ